MKNNILLEVKKLKKYFPVRKGFFRNVTGYVKAVDNISFSIIEGETLGLVGESGCGKSTTARVILKLIEATEGKVIFKGQNILEINQEEIKKIRGIMRIIFQDPYSSLNPKMTIADIVGEPLEVHKIARGKKKRQRINDLLNKVGFSSEYLNRYPHELSGGQLQRIGIARALAVNPKLIVCDEPVSSLDVSIQAQMLNLMMDLQDEYNLAYLFIAHDLSVIKHISNHVAVMYLGKIVELAETKDLFQNTMHPYTKALISAILSSTHKNRKRIILKGEIPSPVNPPAGCRFHTRCFERKNMNCYRIEPKLREIENNHFVSCHFVK